jgi:hypothetical protein
LKKGSCCRRRSQRLISLSGSGPFMIVKISSRRRISLITSSTSIAHRPQRPASLDKATPPSLKLCRAASQPNWKLQCPSGDGSRDLAGRFTARTDLGHGLADGCNKPRGLRIPKKGN